MAAHHLAIAKASFSASLLRPDPQSVSKTSIADFHSNLKAAIHRCTSKNVQTCKKWLLENVFISSSRISVFGKYLVAFSNSIKNEDTNPSAKRRRLHVLYVLHDTLANTSTPSFQAGQAGIESFSQILENFIIELIALAASFTNAPKQIRKLKDLIDIWETKSLFDSKQSIRFRSAIADPASIAKNTTGFNEVKNDITGASKLSDVPFRLPRSHGEVGTPWYDLPAACMIPHILPSTSKPIPVRQMQPIRFDDTTADPNLISVVQDFLRDVEDMYDQGASKGQKVTKDFYEDSSQTFIDLDPLGISTFKNQNTGEIKDGGTYYGWSREFCEQMNRGKKGKSSRSRHSSPIQRRRSISSSLSRSPSPFRRRMRSRSSSGSRSPPPTFRRQSSPSSGRRPASRSRSRDRARDPRLQASSSLNRAPNMEYETSRQDPNAAAPAPQGIPPVPPQFAFPLQQQGGAQMPIPPFFLGPNGVPIPPPPPQGYNGPWPPPPPQLQGNQFPQWPGVLQQGVSGGQAGNFGNNVPLGFNRGNRGKGG